MFAQTTAYMDLVIPRGGESLIKRVVDTAKVPSIETGVGNCHVYVDRDADLAMAEKIVMNAKTQRPSVCNAAESLLVHADVAGQFIPQIVTALHAGLVEVRGCKRSSVLVQNIVPATEDDWGTEYLDLRISVKVVDSVDDAIAHIGLYGSMHSEAIVTNNQDTAKRFQHEIDAAAVLHNCSRFTDGANLDLVLKWGFQLKKCMLADQWDSKK